MKIKNINDFKAKNKMLYDEFVNLLKQSNIVALNNDYDGLINDWIELANEMNERPSVVSYSPYFVLLWCIVKDLEWEGNGETKKEGR